MTIPFNLTETFKHVDDYEERCVGRYKKGDLFVSTVRVYDTDIPYETAVAHPDYNGGEIIVVETYHDLPAAQKGYKKWILRMKQKPTKLFSVQNDETYIKKERV